MQLVFYQIVNLYTIHSFLSQLRRAHTVMLHKPPIFLACLLRLIDLLLEAAQNKLAQIRDPHSPEHVRNSETHFEFFSGLHSLLLIEGSILDPCHHI